MGRSGEAFFDDLDSKFRNLAEENDELRRELRRVLALKGERKPPTWKRRKARRGHFRRYLVIPDTQVKPGVPMEHLAWAGRYIADKRPDVIVHLGDHWDMPSCSSWDKGKRAFEGRRYKADIEAGNEGMRLLVEPFRRKRSYNPEMHFLLGNHEQRIERALDVEPWLEGLIGYENFDLDGWEVHDFLKPVELDGTLFCHYFASPLSGRPIGGTAHNLLRKVGKSCVMGHRQVLDVAVQELPDGTQRRALIAGSFYQHFEKYKSHQGNGHFRGLVVLNEMANGMWDQMEVSLDYLRRKYG